MTAICNPCGALSKAVHIKPCLLPAVPATTNDKHNTRQKHLAHRRVPAVLSPLRVVFRPTASRVTTHAAACSTALISASGSDDRGRFGGAIVLGSGIAGLLAAQALRKQFRKVIVLEADAANSTWHEAGVEDTVSEVCKQSDTHAPEAA